MTNLRGLDQTTEVAAIAEPSAVPASPDLRTLFVMHAGYVWNSLRRLGVPPADLEDLTHDVFVEVQRHLGDFQTARPVRPWLFGFAFRIASAHRRRAHRRREIPGEPERAPDPLPLPDEAFATSERRQLLARALEYLPIERRAVLVLYEIDGVDIETVARTLGIPVNTAYSRLRVARDELRAAVTRLRLRQGDT